MAKKIEIDPAHPLGSLAAGDQQFTIAADTQHGKPSYKALINADLETAARNGVKVVLLEYPLTPMKALTQLYPEMEEAKTWDERRKILRDYATLIEDLPRIEGSKAAKESGVSSLEDRPKWRAAFDRGYDIGQDKARELGIMVATSGTDLKVHELLEDIFTKKPPISDQEIRERSKGFISNHTTPENAAEDAKNFADLMIKSRQLGIDVRFTGDNPPIATTAAVQKTTEAIEWFVEENVEFNEYLKKYEADPKTKPPADTEGFSKFLTKYNQLYDAHNAALDALIESRENAGAEQARADRFLAAADGRKALVLWGQGHVVKPLDINEMLDERLKADALKKGAPPPAPTAVLEIYDSRAQFQSDLKTKKPTDDEPDARYFAKEKQVEITPSGAERLQVKPNMGVAADMADVMTRLTTPALAKPADPAPQPAASQPKPLIVPAP